MNRHACLNRLYRLIWNHARQAWTVAPESARGQGKAKTTRGRSGKLLLATGAALIFPPVWAELPTQGSISAGQGHISNNGNQMVVNQRSDKLALNWQSFSIGKDNRVTFVQPSRQSVALNRVLGADVSSIQGALQANGQVFLLNPNGVVFSPTAQVNVGGLVASTLKLSDEDFLSGNYRFEGDSDAAIVQQGKITAAEGGSIVLIAGQILNYGEIRAPQGQVLLASGSKVRLDLGSDVALEVEAGVVNGLIEQGGLIVADGGRIYLTTKAANQLSTSVINHTGITQARTLVTGEQGEIMLIADMAVGTTRVDGVLDASAPGAGNGGFIETSAAHVTVADSAQVTTLAGEGTNGTWLIDPVDFTVAATGGDMTGTAVTTALSGGNFIIQSTSGGSGTAGDIHINDSISWSANTLTLDALGNININSELFGSGTAGLALQYGQGAVAAGNTAHYTITAPVNLASTGSFSTQLGSDGAVLDYTILTDMGSEGSTTGTDLQGIQGALNGHYVLGTNIDATATRGWNSGAGFDPIGNETAQFTGSVDGLGHVISDLTINRPSESYIGLFGFTEDASISHLGLTEINLRGNDYIGGLVGYSDISSITNSYASGRGNGGRLYVGGLVGSLVGGFITNSYASGSVRGSVFTGGLVGDNSGTITNSYASGPVEGGAGTGGLVGDNSGSITNSYASSSVESSSTVGGLVGNNHNQGTITNSYASGSVKGSSGVGGLVGYNGGAITSSYASGRVSGDLNVSGSVGHGSAAGATGLTTAQMMLLARFSGWDMDDQGGTGAVWRIYEGYTYPLLRSFLTSLDLTPAFDGSGTAITDIAAYSSAISYDASLLLGSISDTLRLSSSNADQYTASISSNLYSTQQGYDIGYSDRVISTPGTIAGDIALNNPISWNSGTLAIDTIGTITANAATNGTGSAVFDLRNGTWRQIDTTLADFSVYDFRLSGGTFIRALGGDGSSDPYQLADIYGLQGVHSNGMLGWDYALANDVDASGTSGWNSGAGFDPIGDEATKFTGSFDGQSHVVSGLTINRPGQDYVGLFGYVRGSYPGSFVSIANVGLMNSTINGRDNVGNLAGRVGIANITNIYATGEVSGRDDVGGLVGWLNTAGVSNSYVSGAVRGTLKAGGAVGSLRNSEIDSMYVVGTVTGGTRGGMAGRGFDFRITNSHWNTETSSITAAVAGYDPDYGNISTVSGLTTAQMMNATSYNGWDMNDQGGTGAVWRLYEGHSYPLLRSFLNPLTVTAAVDNQTYSGSGYTGGNDVDLSVAGALLLGSASYFGSSQGAVNVGDYTLSVAGYFSDQQGYDISYADGELNITPADLMVTAIGQSKTYDTTAYAGGNGLIYVGFVGGEDESVLAGTLSYAGDAQGATNAGGYTITPQGLTSGNYTLSFVDGTLNITPADLTVTAAGQSKTYDATAYAGGNGVNYVGFVGGEDESVLAGTLSYSGDSQGAINTGDYILTPQGLSSGNYTLSFVDGTLNITPADLTVTAAGQSKTYDAMAYAGGNGVNYAGFVGGEDASVLAGTLSYAGDAQGAANAGDYAITPQGLSSGNYTLSFVDGTLSITPAALSVTAVAASKTFDATAYAGGNGVNYVGFVGDDDASTLDGALVYVGDSQGAIQTGSYTITPQGLSSVNYTLSFVDGELTILPVLDPFSTNPLFAGAVGGVQSFGDLFGSTAPTFVNGFGATAAGGEDESGKGNGEFDLDSQLAGGVGGASGDETLLIFGTGVRMP